MAEWWIYGQVGPKKKYPEGWVIFQEYIPDKGIYSIGMSRERETRYNAYWTIFFKVDRLTANKIFNIMKQLYAEGFLKQFQPPGPEGISKEDKKAIAQKVAEKLGKSFTIVIEDEEIAISPYSETSPPPSSGGNGSVGTGRYVPSYGSGASGGSIGLGGQQNFLTPTGTTQFQQGQTASQKSSKRKWFLIGGGVLLLIIVLVIVFMLKK